MTLRENAYIILKDPNGQLENAVSSIVRIEVKQASCGLTIIVFSSFIVWYQYT